MWMPVVLHHSAGTPTGYSPQATWTPDKGSDSSGWQCPPSHSKSSAGAVTYISLESLGTSSVQSQLSPQWFSSFRALENHLVGHHFTNDNAVIQGISYWLWQQPKDFFSAGFQGLVKQWDKCLNAQDDYVEKWNRFQDVTLIIIASIQFCNLHIDSPSYIT